MRLPIDTHSLTFFAVGVPEAVVDFDSKQPRNDADGRPLFSVGVVALVPEGAELLSVKVPGQPRGITPGVPVKVNGLVASTWQMGDRHGVSFRAEAIETQAPAAKTPAGS